MNPIAVAPMGPLIYVLGALLAISLGALVATVIKSGKEGSWTERHAFGMFATCFVAIILLYVGGIISSNVEQKLAAAERTAVIAGAIDKTYGLELTVEEVSQLKWPAEAPVEAFHVYGSIERYDKAGSGMNKTELYLIWNEGGLKLAQSADGERFSELEEK